MNDIFVLVIGVSMLAGLFLLGLYLVGDDEDGGVD